jgi:hypothetical protein
MRAHEIMENLSPTVEQMMLKLRKGAAASLNAARLQEVFDALDAGWKIEKTKFQKPSDGGWLAKELPGAQQYRPSFDRKTGRVYMYAYAPMPETNDIYTPARQAEDQAKVDNLKNDILPQLQALATKTQKKWNVRDVSLDDEEAHGRGAFQVSFQFITDCSGFLITSPDGQTYEVYGDYKNGAINPHTFEMFFRWAVENTDIMDQILEKLGMEAVEKKHDPKKPYTPPPTASAETKKVHAVLTELTNDVREQQRVDLLDGMKEDVERFEQLRSEDVEKAKNFARQNGWLGMIYKGGKRVEDWQAQMEKIATEQVTEMQNMFVYKNTAKLAPILTAKGDIGDITTNSISTRGGVITASLTFTFEDGSHFTVHQSIVQSYVYPRFGGQATFFYRFPTTFHDVVLPDGKKMYPSEENMNEIFAKA